MSYVEMQCGFKIGRVAAQYVLFALILSYVAENIFIVGIEPIRDKGL